jgi:type IV pilus modification protein PilV
MKFQNRNTGIKDNLRNSAMPIKTVTETPKQSNTQGFTLIEVLIAMAIFAIGILAVTSMQMRSIGQNASARMQTEGTTLAVDWLERLLSAPYEDTCLDESYFTENYFDDEGISPIEGGGTYTHECENEAADFLEAQGGSYRIQWMVVEDPDNKGLPLKQIDIEVTSANRNAKTVHLASIKGHDEELPGTE